MWQLVVGHCNGEDDGNDGWLYWKGIACCTYLACQRRKSKKLCSALMKMNHKFIFRFRMAPNFVFDNRDTRKPKNTQQAGEIGVQES